MTAGLYTGWILISNGMHMGAIFGLLQANSMAAGLGEFVMAHGFIELSVIFLAGGCGLYIGDGLLRPGLYIRQAVVGRRARIAGQAIMACVPLLVLAGIIEGFISPSELPWWVKTLVGVGTGVALYWYWLRAGRIVAEQTAPEGGTRAAGAYSEMERGEGEDLFL